MLKKLSYLAISFLLFWTPNVSLAQDNVNSEFRGKYNHSLQCGAYMGNFTILAQKIDDQKLAVAFEAATERYMYEIVNYGGKLGMTKDDAVDELKKLAASLEKGRSGYSEKDIANMTKFCAPEILPLLE
ncbi:hypothetical protein [Ochrobactrum sp. MYb379]|uniref:hypothetical protein n=1 Tax=Ochrobactrum sp. MYb379 TaxID=2745275 RepID=UPI0030A1A9C7